MIREQLQRIVEQRRADDSNPYHLDGRELYGAEDSIGHPLPDNLHPGPASHRQMGKRFALLAFRDGGPFHRFG